MLGQVVEWSIPGKPQASYEFRLKPAGHGLLHVEPQDKAIRLIYVATRPGPVAVTDSFSRVIRRFDVKPWPTQPPAGGITAGTGDFSAQWASITQSPEAGEVVKLSLKVTGHASLAIAQPPKITVSTPAGSELAIFSKDETGWPAPGRTAYRTWDYEFLNTQAGPSRVGPLIFHLLDEKTGQVQARLVPGPAWSTAPRTLFLAPAEATPVANQPSSWGLTIVIPLLSANLLVTLLVIFRHQIIVWGLNIRLRRVRQPITPPEALALIRRYEPVLADIERACPTKKPVSFSLVRQRLRALEKVAFGRPVA